MTILGIDPGTARTGYGLIKKLDAGGNKLKLMTCGCLETQVGLPTAERLKDLYGKLNKLIKKYKPQAMAVEDIFFFKNAKTVIQVSQARGVIILAAAHSRVPVFEYTPLQIKQTVTGDGRADKLQIQKMLQILLKLKNPPQPDDAADAVAAAICCSRLS